MIEIKHDPDHLPFKKIVLVKNARMAYHKVQKLLEAKRARGLRVRYANDVKRNELWLETRNAMAMDTVMQFVRDSGLLR